MLSALEGAKIDPPYHAGPTIMRTLALYFWSKLEPKTPPETAGTDPSFANGLRRLAMRVQFGELGLSSSFVGVRSSLIGHPAACR